MIKNLLRSFAGGEITPELFGRIELGKFQSGLRKILNFFVLPHGPVVRRPGHRYVLEAKDSVNKVRLIPFVFNVDQAVALEFGHNYIRFHIAGQTLLEANKTITAMTLASPGVFTSVAHGYTAGQEVYLQGFTSHPDLNLRYYRIAAPTADTFTLTDLHGTAVSTVGQPAYSAGGLVARVYLIASTYASADLFDIHYVQSADVLTLTHPSYAAMELRRLGATNWTLTAVSFAPTIGAPASANATPTVAVVGNPVTHYYVVTTIAADNITESLPTAVISAVNDLTLAGNFNTIAWAAVVGASRYNVYKSASSSGSFGFIGQATGLSLVDNNILADATHSYPESLITLNGSAGNFPATATYHEQRRLFAGTDNNQQTVYATRNGTESNLTSSLPSRDDDALKFKLAALQQNRIRHLIPLTDLIALTASGEWRIFADGAAAITPTSLSTKPQGYTGASNVQPAVTVGSILYVQAQGSRIRELGYGGDSANNGYKSIDISIMAPHLFNGFTITDIAYAKAPEQIMWAVRNDGTLLGMTYVPDQQVYGWHQHTTDGLYESVCVIPEGNEDATYVVVKRTINGRTVRIIERLAGRLFTDAKDAYFVDCGATYDGTPATIIRGLWHLEGKTVQILADAAVEPQQVVANGRVTLTAPASKVHIGLPYLSDLITLPLAVDGAPAAGQGTIKNILAASLRHTQTSLFKVGINFTTLVSNKSRQISDPYGSPPALRTAESRVTVPGDWDTDGVICVRQDQPLPCTILALVLEAQFGG
jgi:hypothetical protein